MRVLRAMVVLMILMLPVISVGDGAMDIKSDELRRVQKKAGKSPGVSISGVLFGGGRTLAVIDNAYYHVGDTVKGYSIKAISDGGMYLERGGAEYFVGLGGK